jgi:hypothetical protein
MFRTDQEQTITSTGDTRGDDPEVARQTVDEHPVVTATGASILPGTGAAVLVDVRWAYAEVAGSGSPIRQWPGRATAHRVSSSKPRAA